MYNSTKAAVLYEGYLFRFIVEKQIQDEVIWQEPEDIDNTWKLVLSGLNCKNYILKESKIWKLEDIDSMITISYNQVQSCLVFRFCLFSLKSY